MSKFYKSKIQKHTVIHGTKALIDLSEKLGVQISKETLNLICDRYCYVYDPPEGPGSDIKYHKKSSFEEAMDRFDQELEKI